MSEATGTASRWHLRGRWFDACKCAIPCPCSFAQPPTYGDCNGILVWHIDEGRYGETALDQLNVAMLASFTGNLWTGEHTDPFAAVFLDERADQAQREGLQTIFGGQAGGWPAQLIAAFHPEIRGMDYAPIEVSIDDDLASWSVRVADHAEATVEALSGPTSPEGGRVEVRNLPGSETGPGQGPAIWGRATADRADAFGFRWDREGYSSKLIPFDWTGPDAA
ncbi:MAG: DUF1326 domain-containing protein [Actinomycetota bacterium]|nr:DUF1326 domain-containing protein [Actinomycetota bacterium]